MNHNYHHGDLKNALIRAGIELLSREGVQALTLRSVAKQAGVSHAAPYAHFADKQALIAAIAAAGYATLYAQLATAQTARGDALERLYATADAYLQFALDEPDHFKITFSGVVEAEKDYPDYVEQSRRCFALVVALVADCQADGVIVSGDTQLIAVSIWSCMHGFVHLWLANQLPSALLSRYAIPELLRMHLARVVPFATRRPE